MLQFAQSIWLWTATGIIVPVIIHLWNVRQGKTLKVGSIIFFKESATTRAKSLKLSHLLLLLLRCLLLIVMAVLIAQPFYVKQLNAQKEKGWILIEKKQVHEAYKKFKATIDTLIKSGYTFHYFKSGFKEAKFEDVLKMPVDTLAEPEASYWTVLKELDQKVPAKLPVYVFTDNSLRRFSGSRPEVSLNLHWHVFASPDTVSQWIEKAFKLTVDSLRLVIANSTHTATSYAYQNISSRGTNNKFASISADGKIYVKYSDTSKTVSNKAVELDTSALVITIYTDRFALDANYLRAAINAIKDFTRYKMRVAVVNNIQNIPANASWLFWLSEAPIPRGLIKNNVFLYEKGKIENLRSRIITEDKVPVTTTGDVRMYKSVSQKESVTNGFNTVWKNGFGEPVLTVENSTACIYHFYNRFNPQWNDLTWSNQFPEIILNLLFGKKRGLNFIDEADKRIIDVTQMQPVITPEHIVSRKESLSEKRDLSKVFWLIAFILFFVERIISSKTKKEIEHA